MHECFGLYRLSCARFIQIRYKHLHSQTGRLTCILSLMPEPPAMVGQNLKALIHYELKFQYHPVLFITAIGSLSVSEERH